MSSGIRMRDKRPVASLIFGNCMRRVEECTESALDAGYMEESAAGAPPKPNSALAELIFNFVIPILVLKKLDDFVPLDSAVVLCVALAFPLGFGIRDFVRVRKVNVFSVLGMVNVLLTGVIGVLELPPRWVAVKEAAIPGILGLVVVISMWTPYPLVRTLLYNPKILKVDLINAKLEEHDAKEGFEKTLKHATWYLAASFFLSAGLNYALAKIMVKTSPAVDRAAFNNEIGSMWIWSYVVIVVPSVTVMMIALWTIFRGIKAHAGLTMEEVMVGLEEEKKAPSTN